jgi:undecaprenyl-diphosphatase
MMQILESIFFGAVQGLTEFLPVSSSGHLVLLHSIADLRVGNDLAFDVALHMGTLVALVVFFRSDLIRLARGWIRSLRGQANSDGRLAWLILIGTCPAAIAGWWLEDTLVAVARQPESVAVVLVFGGVVLWAVDRWSRRSNPVESLSIWSVLAIGVGQALALIPGVSRSGATIIVGRWVGLGREAAARFSFLLSAPIILGAGLKQGFELRGLPLNLGVFAVGMVTAAVVGYFAIRWLLRLVQQHSYAPFAVYRVVLGVIAWLYFRGR